MSKPSSVFSTFDPNAVGQLGHGIFGLPFDANSAETVIVSVPWEVTTSYGEGTADGPDAVFVASAQVDLYHPDFAEAWKSGIALSPIETAWNIESTRLKAKAMMIIDAQADGVDIEENAELSAALDEINAACAHLHDEVDAQVTQWLKQGKRVGLLGGDHSVSLGALRAMSRVYPEFGVLQIDAHMDLRDAYEGFTYSHASIMFNALAIPEIKSLVQVGIRDCCEAEMAVAHVDSRVHVVMDQAIKEAGFLGKTWKSQCDEIIGRLPQHVYISFDIDGLHPSLCPNTGTPVPGGLQLEEVNFLFKQLVMSGRKIIGFDLVEVSPGDGDWDANVGARALYSLFGYSWASNPK